MPHSRNNWRTQVKAAEREYQTARVAMDCLQDPSDDDIHQLTEERGWDDLARLDINVAERNLDATYLIRMYAVFEQAVGSFWRQTPGNEGREVDGGVMLYEVGSHREMNGDVIESAQAVRTHRNNLVHRRFQTHASVMTIEDASRDLLTYLNRLPATWA